MLGKGRRGAFVGLIVLACLLLPTGSPAADPIVVRHPVYGGAQTLFGTCPYDTIFPPPAGTCADTFVFFFRGYSILGGGSVSPAHAPWLAVAETVELEWDGVSPDPVQVTLVRFGFGVIGGDDESGFGAVEGEAFVDRARLQEATLNVTIPMSDGSTFDFEGTWSPISDRFQFGNDGPDGGRVHIADRCITINEQAHQKFVMAEMSGTLNGAAVHSYKSFFSTGIFNNNFRHIEVAHRDDCP